jgi:hypothetical protein
MSQGSERWRCPARLGPELPSRSVWRAAPMGLDQPVKSIITTLGVVMMSSASPPWRTSTACLPCTSPRVTWRSWQDPLATRPEGSSRGTGPEPSLVCHFILARGEAFSYKLPSLQRGEAFSLRNEEEGRLLVLGNALPGEKLTGGSAAGIVP